MAGIVVPGPSLLYVRWGCRRCGFRGGVARTTVPMADATTSAPAMRNLLGALRRKLARKHMRDGCIAVPDDFILEAHLPDRQRVTKL